jgi:hypothetical protein
MKTDTERAASETIGGYMDVYRFLREKIGNDGLLRMLEDVLRLRAARENMDIDELVRAGKDTEDIEFFSQVDRPLGPGFPKESSGLHAHGLPGFALGVVGGVNDSSARLVEGFQPTEYELELLAQHYVDRINDMTLFQRCTGQIGTGDWRLDAFSNRRLDTIRRALGQDKFDAAISKTLAKWKQEFADAENSEQSLAPCTKCGGKRSLPDAANDPIGRCHACAIDDWEASESGVHANEGIARCANCRATLGPDDSILCGACRKATEGRRD